MSILFEWRINDIERKAEEASRRLWELDNLSSNVASLERSLGEARSENSELRYQLQELQENLRQLEMRVVDLVCK